MGKKRKIKNVGNLKQFKIEDNKEEDNVECLEEKLQELRKKVEDLEKKY